MSRGGRNAQHAKPTTGRKLPQSRAVRSHGEPPLVSTDDGRALTDHGQSNLGERANGDSLAERLHYLFDSTRQRDGSRWTLNAVARASGGRLSAQAVYSLYTGHSTNPMLETIRTLADVFGVEPEFFVRSDSSHKRNQHAIVAPETTETDPQTDPQIAYVSRSMKHLPPADKSLIVDFVRRLSMQVGAPASDPPDHARSAQLSTIPDGLRKDLPSP